MTQRNTLIFYDQDGEFCQVAAYKPLACLYQVNEDFTSQTVGKNWLGITPSDGGTLHKGVIQSHRMTNIKWDKECGWLVEPIESGLEKVYIRDPYLTLGQINEYR